MRATRTPLLVAVLALALTACTAEEPAARATAEREPEVAAEVEMEPAEEPTFTAEPEPVVEEPAPAPVPDPTQGIVDAVQAGDWVAYCGAMADASVSGYDMAAVGAERVAELRTIFYDACLENVPGE